MPACAGLLIGAELGKLGESWTKESVGLRRLLLSIWASDMQAPSFQFSQGT